MTFRVQSVVRVGSAALALASTACSAHARFYGPSALLSPPPLRLETRVIRGDSVARSIEIELALSTHGDALRVCVGFPWDYTLSEGSESEGFEDFDILTVGADSDLCYGPAVVVAPSKDHVWRQQLGCNPKSAAFSTVAVTLRVYLLDDRSRPDRKRFWTITSRPASAAGTDAGVGNVTPNRAVNPSHSAVTARACSSTRRAVGRAGYRYR
jgi:hypothetical protein